MRIIYTFLEEYNILNLNIISICIILNQIDISQIVPLIFLSIYYFYFNSYLHIRFSFKVLCSVIDISVNCKTQ